MGMYKEIKRFKIRRNKIANKKGWKKNANKKERKEKASKKK